MPPIPSPALFFLLAAALSSVEGKCVYQAWTEWTKCSEPCSGGTQSRYRPGTGDTCEPNYMERACNTATCLPPTLDPLHSTFNFEPDAGLQKIALSGIMSGSAENQKLTVQAASSNEAVVSDVKVRYRSPESMGEISYVVKAAGEATLRVMVMNEGATHIGPQFGGSETEIIVTAPVAYCKTNQRVQGTELDENGHMHGGKCVPCEPGTVRMAGDATNKGDTECEKEQCQENERVLNNRCVPCMAGEVHDHDAAADGGDTQCESIVCQENYHVQQNKCVRCPAGQTRPEGDMANGYNTYCDQVSCQINEFMQANKCTPCPKGLNSPGGDAMECIELLCKEGEHVHDFECKMCAAGYTHGAGSSTAGADTECELIECRDNEAFDGQVCVSCPPGHTHPGRASILDDADCDVQICGPNEQNNGVECVMCPAGTHSPGGHTVGDDHSGCTTLTCSLNEKVQANLCVSCPAGHVTEPGHASDGTDTDCTPLVCPTGQKVSGANCVMCDPNDHSVAADGTDNCAQALQIACGAADAMVLMDMSGSIGPENFMKMKEYAKQIAETMQISPEGTHAALITFSTEAKMEFDFDEGNDVTKFSDSVDALQFRPGQDTRIDLAVELAAKVMGAHSELETPKIVVILTDGRQTGGGADVLPAAIAPLMALGAEIVVIGMGEEVDPKELMLLVHDESELVLSDFEQLTHQIEELAVRICVGGESQQAPPAAADMSPAMSSFFLPDGYDYGAADEDGYDCKNFRQAACQSASSSCDWCRFRSVCANNGECPGARRTPEGPAAVGLPTCACSGGGVKYSSVSQSHFCWLSKFPCVGAQGAVIVKQWSDCDDLVNACPASLATDEHPYVLPVATAFSARQCFDVARRGQCRAHSKCNWCPVAKGCAPKGLCKTLKKNKPAATTTTPAVMRPATTAIVRPAVPATTTVTLLTSLLNPKMNFQEVLAVKMEQTLGPQRDPRTQQNCLTSTNLCAAGSEHAYCCPWQSSLVAFYNDMTVRFGLPQDPVSKMACFRARDPCQTSNYCCEYQQAVVDAFTTV